MERKILPTRANLRRIKQDLKIAKDGFELLDKKREVLMTELMRQLAGVRQLYKQLSEELTKFYTKYILATIYMGQTTSELFNIQNASRLILSMYHRSIMGVEVVELRISDAYIHKPGLAFSNLRMDELLNEAQELQRMLVEYVEKRYVVERLVREIKRTQRRVNALEVVFIPMYEKIKRWIEDVLEEGEREGFVRQKMVKSKLARKRFV